MPWASLFYAALFLCVIFVALTLKKRKSRKKEQIHSITEQNTIVLFFSICYNLREIKN